MGCQMIDDYYSYPSFWPMKIRDKHTNACSKSRNLSSLLVHQKFARLQMMLVKQPTVFTSDLCRPGGNRIWILRCGSHSDNGKSLLCLGWKVTVWHLRQACNMTCKNSDFRRISYWKGAKEMWLPGFISTSNRICSQVVVRIGKPSTSVSLLSLKSLHVKRSSWAIQQLWKRKQPVRLKGLGSSPNWL